MGYDRIPETAEKVPLRTGGYYFKNMNCARSTWELASPMFLLLLYVSWGFDFPSVFILGVIAAWMVTWGLASRTFLEALLVGMASSLPASWLTINLGAATLHLGILFYLLVAAMIIVLLISLTPHSSFRKGIDLAVIGLGVLAFIGSFYAILVSPDKILGLRAFLAMSLLFVARLFILHGRYISRAVCFEKVVRSYIYGAAVLSFFVLVQAFFFWFYEIEIGNVHSRPGRVSLGAGFADYSVVSGFFATALAIVIFLGFYKSAILSVWGGWTLAMCFALAIVFVGARTGVVAFVLGSIAGVVFLFFIGRGRIGLIAGVLMAGVLNAIGLMLFTRRSLSGPNEGWLSGQRAIEFKIWVEQFSQASVLDRTFGFSMGSKNHQALLDVTTPHNLILETLLNGGVVLGVFLGLLLWVGLLAGRQYPFIVGAVMTVVVASMFMPSSLGTRVLPFILLIGVLGFVSARFRGKECSGVE